MSTEPNHPSEQRPKVTLVVLAYNQEDIVGQAIQSCLDQTYQSLEIVLSDDASSDGTWEVIEGFASTYEGPHTIKTNRNEKNLGLAGHMNRLLEMASGTLILCCAGDDICLPERVARMVETWLMAPDTTKAISSSYAQIAMDGTDQGLVSATMRKRWIPDPTAMEIAKGRIWCVGATMTWHRDIFDQFGPLPPDAPHEDTFILFRAALLGRVVYLDEPLVRKRIGGISDPLEKRELNPEIYREKLVQRKATIEAFLSDLQKTPSVGVAKLQAVCTRSLSAVDMQIRILDLPARAPFAQLLLIGWHAIKAANLVFFVSGLKIVFLKLYLRLRKFRLRPTVKPKN